MSPWFGKAAVLAAAVAMIAIRAPHGQRSRSVPVRRSARGRLETALLTFAWLCFFLPLFWVATPWLAFADYPLHPAAWGVGVGMLAVGLWLFHRSHADLGTNWSITLVVREEHALVTTGVYRRVRHPMYLALILYGVGQLLVLPNWLAGPTYLVAMVLITAFRLAPEERLLREEFGEAWEAYRRGTARLLPGIW